jgi:ABC-2 type transport system ATP-binding protein
MTQPIVEIDGLEKSYQDIHAVQGISFNVLQGEIFSLLGPNGAGKTTTISMLSGLLRPTSGDARLGGHSICDEPEAVKRIIGVVPQEVALYETLNGVQNLNFWGRMYGMGGATLKQRIEEVLDQVGLRERAGDRVETYSGGMKRRLNIAAGLLHRPEILFMDEPTVGIDPQSRRNILEMVKQLRDQGMTVLYTTHYMEEAEELSDRVGIIDHGKLIALGTQEELTRLIGSQEVVRLTVAEQDDTAGVAQRFADLPDVRHATNGSGTLTLTVSDASAALAPIMARANELELHVRTVRIEEPNLEAVFLHLTGRALRD